MTKKKAFFLIHGMLIVAVSKTFSPKGLAIVSFLSLC